MNEKYNSYQFKLSELVEKLSHELRTPLSAILGYSELLEKSANLDEDEKSHLRKISTSGSQLLDVINDILEISNLESGKTDIEEKTICISDIVSELKTKFKVQARFKEIDFKVHVASQRVKYFVADGKKLKTIIYSLVNNAIKFTEGGKIEVKFDMAGNSSEKLLKVVVSDSGIGIREEEFGQIFDPFWQGANDRRSGTGLGLTTCKKLVEILGGTISIDSVFNKGTKASIEIPVKEASKKSSKFLESANKQTLDQDSNLTALVVDDLPVNRTLARIMLEMRNFRIIEAENGKQALKCYQSNKPDVVLMDISMPVMDGVEAMKKIRGVNGSGKNIPIIAVTAGGHGGTRNELIESGFSEYIQKPFKEKELFEKLSMFLPASQSFPKSKSSAAPLKSQVV
ncbi:response regulator [Gracilimonas tropica]|uniref:response regulator n=1 Tax=Gracilimonas tropica TaxID=454600 RepID=UPI0003A7E16B|nr:response regulator [Gracilimonas tropica]